jgi:hypothetical protein
MRSIKERPTVMSNGHRGKLVLQEAPSGEVEKKVVMLLSQFAKSATREQLTEKVRNTPYFLSNDIPAEKALIILEALQKLGATAAFVPHVPLEQPDEEITVVEPEPRRTFNAPLMTEERPPFVQPEPRKNSTRRLVGFLVTILLLLSLGYLAYQLWPFLGDSVGELISYIKQLF